MTRPHKNDTIVVGTNFKDISEWSNPSMKHTEINMEAITRLAMLTLSDEEKEKIIHCGLSALAGEAFDE